MGTVPPDPLGELESRLGYVFFDRALLARALRHGSAASASDAGSYQRLEFLGDAVLGHAVAHLVYRAFPDRAEGGLTRMKAQLTRSATLAAKALELGLDAVVELGPSEEKAGGRRRRTLMEDVFEAVVGAMALDGGWEAAQGFVERMFGADLAHMDDRSLVRADPKTALQEAAQGRGLPLPEYREVEHQGPDHRRHWVFEVVWNGAPLARGEGSSKREAQQEAALRALDILGLVPGAGGTE
ncbi:MAG: ribonuclease III [Acidobacteria bacterium]|nr:ribonuclease III [Acidobacteriota bacterium]